MLKPPQLQQVFSTVKKNYRLNCEAHKGSIWVKAAICSDTTLPVQL